MQRNTQSFKDSTVWIAFFGEFRPAEQIPLILTSLNPDSVPHCPKFLHTVVIIGEGFPGIHQEHKSSGQHPAFLVVMYIPEKKKRQ